MLGNRGEYSAVHFAVRPLVVAKHLGLLLIPLAVLTVVPGLVCAAFGDLDAAARYGLVVISLFAFGVPAARLRCTSELQTNEALSVIALAFVVSAIAMSYPLTAYGFGTVDAVFEAVSGVTTTGLSVLPSVEGREPALLFARAWMQWVGGLGVVVLALALTVDAGAAARQLGAEPREREDLVGNTRAHSRRVLVVYLALTGLAGGVLLACGAGGLDAAAYAMAAVSTGGFSTHDASAAGLESIAARSALFFFGVVGALSFGRYLDYRRPLALLRDERIAAFAVAMLLVTGLLLWLDDAPLEAGAVGRALATAASAQSTTGFSLGSVGEPDAQLLLIGSMLVGGEVGSTAGGIKVLRALILLRLLELMLVRMAVPRGTHLRIRVAGHPIGSDEVETALAIIAGYLLVIGVSWLVFLSYGVPPMPALFEVVSATSTTGLSSGVTGPDLEPALKLVLCMGMLAGRVETVALVVLLYPRTWFGMRRSAR